MSDKAYYFIRILAIIAGISIFTVVPFGKINLLLLSVLFKIAWSISLLLFVFPFDYGKIKPIILLLETTILPFIAILYFMERSAVFVLIISLFIIYEIFLNESRNYKNSKGTIVWIPFYHNNTKNHRFLYSLFLFY